MKKNIKIFGIALIVGAIVIISISTANYQRQSALVRNEVFDKCKMIATELKHTREYLAETIAVSNLMHHKEARGLMPAIAGSAIGKRFYEDTGYRLRQISSKYRNPDNKPDEFEEKALLEFQKDKTLSEFKGVDKIKGQRVLRYLIPLYIEEACLKCHSEKNTVPDFIQEKYPDDRATDYSAGDLRGAISVTVPIDKAESEIKGNLIHITILTAIGTIFLVAFIAVAMNISVKKIDNKE